MKNKEKLCPNTFLQDTFITILSFHQLKDEAEYYHQKQKCEKEIQDIESSLFNPFPQHDKVMALVEKIDEIPDNFKLKVLFKLICGIRGWI